MPAAHSNSSVVDNYLKEELEHGRLVVVECTQAGRRHSRIQIGGYT